MIVKICGITNQDDARAAVEAGASALGFNFYRHSPRYISPTGASLIGEKVPASVWKVGIFVDEAAPKIARIAIEAGLDIVQLHGEAQCSSFRSWRVYPVRDEIDLECLNEDDAEAVLLDTASVDLRGGTGLTFRWELAKRASDMTAKKIIIAGGLDETNVEQAIAAAAPWGVDACSRLEVSPGRKDHAKMKRFIQAVLTA